MAEEVITGRTKRSKKNYEAPKLASAFQKQRFKEFQERVKNGEPCVLLSANHPLEFLIAIYSICLQSVVYRHLRSKAAQR